MSSSWSDWVPYMVGICPNMFDFYYHLSHFSCRITFHRLQTKPHFNKSNAISIAWFAKLTIDLFFGWIDVIDTGVFIPKYVQTCLGQHRQTYRSWNGKEYTECLKNKTKQKFKLFKLFESHMLKGQDIFNYIKLFK